MSNGLSAPGAERPAFLISGQWGAGELEVTLPCDVIIDARAVEEDAVVHPSGLKLVRTRFEADPASKEALDGLEAENPGAVIVGSIILPPKRFPAGCWP